MKQCYRSFTFAKKEKDKKKVNEGPTLLVSSKPTDKEITTVKPASQLTICTSHIAVKSSWSHQATVQVVSVIWKF